MDMLRRLAVLLAALALPCVAQAQGVNFIWYWPGSYTFLPAGSATNPSLASAANPNSGIYFASTDLYITRNGVLKAGMNGLYWAAASGFDVGFSGDLFIVRSAAATLQFGVNAATATNQTIKAPDSTGAGIAGGILYLGSSTGGAGGERGPVAFADGGTKPTCAAGIRGAIWYDAGGAGVLDTLEVCRKDAGNAYTWVSLF
jgi:hypothetical protein